MENRINAANLREDGDGGGIERGRQPNDLGVCALFQLFIHLKVKMFQVKDCKR